MRVEVLPSNAADPAVMSPAYRVCLEIRRQVFVEGQAVPKEIEFDGLDVDANHFLAFGDAEDVPAALGTARMRVVESAAKAERIAVLEHARGLGIGRALVESIERHARDRGLFLVRLNAQVRSAGFYEKLGYRAEGDVFEEAGIDHRSMRKRLL